MIVSTYLVDILNNEWGAFLIKKNLTQSDNYNKTSLASAEHQQLIRTIGVSTIIIIPLETIIKVALALA